MKPILFLSLVGALALSACNNNDSAGNDAAADTAMASATPAATDTAASTAPDTSTPQGFVDMAASSDMYEIEAGKLAQQQGKSEKVKSFGAMMVKDHTASTQKLKDAVGQAGEGVMLPTAMQPKHQQMLDGLKNGGDSFDKMYAEQQVAAHAEALKLMQAQAESGTAAPLKKFAADLTPVIKHHGDEANQLP